MAYDSRVYRILIASPSDVEEERKIAVKVIQEWNDLHSYNRKVTLLPLRWETHTAPEYGTRPQEVINRAIVDQCDLLVGIFWTRIGSPTGETESGTLEEIERVGEAGKPVMLYFSRVGADPGSLDLSQVERLNRFKENSYPHGLVEFHETHLEFRDKFATQLELKVRELQQADSIGEPSVAVGFYLPDGTEVSGDKWKRPVLLPVVSDLDEVAKRYDKESERLRGIVSDAIQDALSIPVLLTIRSTGTSGVRNLYGEVTVRANKEKVSIRENLPQSPFHWSSSGVYYLQDPGSLIQHSEGWRFEFEWSALQPQRLRLVEPAIIVAAKESTEIEFSVKLYAESFPNPITLAATLAVEAIPNEMKLAEFIPDLDRKIAESHKWSAVPTTTLTTTGSTVMGRSDIAID